MDSVLGGTVGPREVANPGYQQDLDASRNSTLDNPLATGKKQVEASATQEWGSLRYGVPKSDTAFGLPIQTNPPATNDQNEGGGGNIQASQSFVKGSGPSSNNVM